MLVAIVIYLSVRYSNVVLFVIAIIYMFSGIWARAAYSGRAGAEGPWPAAAVPAEEDTEKRDSLRYL